MHAIEERPLELYHLSPLSTGSPRGGVHAAIIRMLRVGMAKGSWLRQADPTFDASLATEFMDFSGPEINEGMTA